MRGQTFPSLISMPYFHARALKKRGVKVGGIKPREQGTDDLYPQDSAMERVDPICIGKRGFGEEDLAELTRPAIHPHCSRPKKNCGSGQAPQENLPRPLSLKR